MRLLKGLSIFIFALTAVAMAGVNKMGIHEVNHVSFDAAVRVGTALLPAGDYVVRHTMEGQDHVMVFQRELTKEEYKVKCTLVPLSQKVEKNESVVQVNANNERVLQELRFRGDTAKHVF